ncbi:MAG: AAA family ATPase [Candidatus Lokiarchaeota archaeon]|nr:AAA family ATPase [Candidatus Lokiarchaeota archaeon]
MSNEKKSIYIMSTAHGSGKTALIIGLYLNLKEDGHKPGYFKPVGDPFSNVRVTKADKDVNVIHRMLERKYSRDEICPVFISPNSFLDEVALEKVDGIKDLIQSAFDDMIKKTDILLVEGNHFYQQMYSIRLCDLALSKMLNSEIILTSKCENDGDLDRTLIAAEKIKREGLPLIGVIFSNVSELQQTKIKEKYINILNKYEIDLLGTIPKSRLLSSPTIGEVLEATQGKLLTEDFEVVKNNIVEKFIIGAMQCSDAIGYMRKSTNLGVITGGDRADIIITAIEVGVSLIVLTGNLQPDIVALAKAKEAGVPIILVAMDTYTTAHNIQNIHSQIQQSEVDLCKKQVKDNIDWKKLL